MNGTHPQFEHERYEELCALATAGALTAQESEALFAHLDECAECSEMFAQYESLAADGMPLLAHRYAPAAKPAFEEESALAKLLQTAKQIRPEVVPAQRRLFQWLAQPASLGLIAASLILGVGIFSYKLGQSRHELPAAVTADAKAPAPKALAGADPHVLEASLKADGQRIEELQQLADTRSADVEKLRTETKETQDRIDSLTASLAASKADAASQIAALTEQRDASLARLHDAEQSYQTVQEELNTLRSQHSQDLLRMASLEDQVGSLNVALNEQGKRVRNDEQYLSSDKDIRDLIGARNLYIADIMDVRGDGTSRKPFGRVFYTKTKSLIFYAYDLDRQPGIKRASIFQVWGRTGPDDKKPINLGVLYMDSETNRRWTLRVDDPQQLAQLDAVFVTVEPHGESDKPTGKPFLYASLRREPNHP